MRLRAGRSQLNGAVGIEVRPFLYINVGVGDEIQKASVHVERLPRGGIGKSVGQRQLVKVEDIFFIKIVRIGCEDPDG